MLISHYTNAFFASAQSRFKSLQKQSSNLWFQTPSWEKHWFELCFAGDLNRDVALAKNGLGVMGNQHFRDARITSSKRYTVDQNSMISSPWALKSLDSGHMYSVCSTWFLHHGNLDFPLHQIHFSHVRNHNSETFVYKVQFIIFRVESQEKLWISFVIHSIAERGRANP